MLAEFEVNGLFVCNEVIFCYSETLDWNYCTSVVKLELEQGLGPSSYAQAQCWAHTKKAQSPPKHEPNFLTRPTKTKIQKLRKNVSLDS